MNDADKSQQVSAIIQVMRGFAPIDKIEGMMASQAAALHIGAMECFRRATVPEQSSRSLKAYESKASTRPVPMWNW